MKNLTKAILKKRTLVYKKLLSTQEINMSRRGKLNSYRLTEIEYLYTKYVSQLSNWYI